MREKLTVLLALVGVVLPAAAATAATPIAPAFVYQGRITSDGIGINETADFQFTLWDAPAGSNMIGPVVTKNAVTVVHGLFSTDLDFGAAAFSGQARWLEIAVRAPAGGGAFTTLSPRQPLTAAPYALEARGLRLDPAGNLFISETTAQANVVLGTDPGVAATLGTPDGPTAGRGLLLKAGGVNVPLEVVPGGVLRLQAGNASVGLPSSTPGTSQGNDIEIVAGDNIFPVMSPPAPLTGGDDWNGNIVFRAGHNQPERMRIVGDNGRVGIGTDSPSQRLSVAGTVESLTGGFKFPDGSVQSTAAGSGLWSANGSNIFYNAGAVGIGTSSPGAELEVRGTPHAEISFGGVSAPLWMLRGNSADIGGFFEFVDATAGATRIAIRSSGRIGIGTIDPLASFDVMNGLLMTREPDGTGDLRVLGANGQLNVHLGNAAGDGNRGIVTVADAGGQERGRLYVHPAGAGLLSLLGDSGGPNVELSHPAGRPDEGRIAVKRAGSDRIVASVDADGAGELSLDGPNGFGNLRFTHGSGQPGFGRVEALNASGAIRASFSVEGSGNGTGAMALLGENGSVNVLMAAQSGQPNRGAVGVYDENNLQRVSMSIDASGSGRLVCDVMQINGGADIAEPFNVNHDRSTSVPDPAPRPPALIEPGVVVCIDRENPGELRLSDRSYDRTVAGIISGAGGVKPGMILQQAGTVTDGKHPVALTGRVYGWVDADTGGPVEPGDLLTTSDTPGHAMKVTDHARANGAILGKAMTSLESGRGLVLVLVSLQ